MSKELRSRLSLILRYLAYNDVLLKRTISSIGEVHSCKIESNFEDKDSNKKLEVLVP